MERVINLSPAYGFDDVSIAPGAVTINPEMVSTSVDIEGFCFGTPIFAAAMDAIVDPPFAVKMHKAGGLGILNLEGVQTKYEDPSDVLAEIVSTPAKEVTRLLQKLYAVAVRPTLIRKSVQAVKDQGALCAVSVTPAGAKRLAPIAVSFGADIIVVQGTVTTATHRSNSPTGLQFPDFIEQLGVPVIIGNCATYDAALELMATGVSGVLVGVGPGAACTTREVTGVGVPQVTATMDCAAARDEHYQTTGIYIPVITDGGIRTGGDLAKAIAAGADAAMLGTPLAQAHETPGGGYNWGMATGDEALPRGTRIEVKRTGTVQEILFGPTSLTNGTQNLMGGLRAAMGMVGAENIRDMHKKAKLVAAPSIKTEGKHFQLALA